MFTKVNVQESVVLSLLLRDQVYIEDNFFFVNGPFKEFLWSMENNVVRSAIEHGLIVPLVKYDATSFSELVEKMEAKMSSSMGISEERASDASKLDQLLKIHSRKIAFHRLPDSGISLYDEVLQRLLTGAPPILDERGLERAKVNQLWERTDTIRAEWLGRALETRRVKGNLSCAKSDFVRYAAAELGVDSPKSLMDLKERAPTHQHAMDILQVAKWAHDANYISRGEAIGCGTSVFMPNDMEAAMILKSQTSVPVPGFEETSTTVEVHFPTMDRLMKADWKGLLDCRLSDGKEFFDYLSTWSLKSPEVSGKERVELDGHLSRAFGKYARAINKVCDGNLADDFVTNFLAKFTVGQGAALAPQIANAAGGYLVQYLVRSAVELSKVGQAMQLAYGLFRYRQSPVTKRKATLGSDSGVTVDKPL